MQGLPTPKYIKNVTFTNNSSQPVRATVHFHSNKTLQEVINPGENKTIEQQVDHGSFTTIDAIESADLTRAGTHTNILHFDKSNVNGIECRNYIIRPDFQVIGIQKID